VLVPELRELAGFDGSHVTATLRPNRWELRAERNDPEPTVVDRRLRLLVPPGVRQQLALDGSAVISLALDASRVVVWSSRVLDNVVEVSA